MSGSMNVNGPLDLSMRKDEVPVKNVRKETETLKSSKPEASSAGHTVARPWAMVTSPSAPMKPKTQKPVSVVLPQVAKPKAQTPSRNRATASSPSSLSSMSTSSSPSSPSSLSSSSSFMLSDSPPPLRGQVTPPIRRSVPPTGHPRFQSSGFNPFMAFAIQPPPIRTNLQLLYSPMLYTAHQQMGVVFQQNNPGSETHQQLLDDYQLDRQQNQQRNNMWFQGQTNNNQQVQLYAAVGSYDTPTYRAHYPVNTVHNTFMPTSSAALAESSAYPVGYGSMQLLMANEVTYNNSALHGSSKSNQTFNAPVYGQPWVENASSSASSMDREQDVFDRDIANIYMTPDFQLFRQRYVKKIGPPRNSEKMRRSVPAERRGGQPPEYVQKRIKNNEAAKKSRDAKRQNFIENQICVDYLYKKIKELNDLKAYLMLRMADYALSDD